MIAEPIVEQPSYRRVAIVTGATGNIGPAIGRQLCADGFQVVLTGRREDALSSLRKEMAQRYDPAPMALPADLTQRTQVVAAVDKILAEFGRIDVVVNNAGGWAGSYIGPFLEKTEDQLRAELDNNLWSTVLVCHAVLPIMVRQRYGRIINVSSIAGQNGSPGHALYAAAKAGQIGLSKVLSVELGQFGITINSVAPGVVVTPQLREGLAEGSPRRPSLLAKIDATPTRRFAEAEDIARSVSFLASEGASDITGQTLSVSGGLFMGL